MCHNFLCGQTGYDQKVRFSHVYVVSFEKSVSEGLGKKQKQRPTLCGTTEASLKLVEEGAAFLRGSNRCNFLRQLSTCSVCSKKFQQNVRTMTSNFSRYLAANWIFGRLEQKSYNYESLSLYHQQKCSYLQF